MTGCINLSPYKLSLNNNIFNAQDININNINNNSIRRTLSSADMSSPKWCQNNGFSLKRIHSFDMLQNLDDHDHDHHVNEEMINKKEGSGGAAFEDIWSSILTQKKPGSADPVPAPYVHPVVKRASSLSEKSLEICTESLGSETGSDGFSYPVSDHGDEQEVDEVNVVEEEVKSDYVVEVVKANYPIINKNKKISNFNNNSGVVRSFPPPLPSLANRDDGSNLQIRTRREEGKVVVEAVSVPSRNCFRACRQDGRLLLTLTNDIEIDEHEFSDDDVVDGDGGDDRVVENEINIVRENVESKLALVVEDNNSYLPTTRVINVRTAFPTMIMTKLMELTSNRNMSAWPRGFNRTVTISLEEGDDEDMLGKQAEVGKIAARQKAVQSLPPRPRRVSTTTSAVDVLNAYEYYWRRSDSPTAAAVAVLKPLAGKQNNTSVAGTGVGLVSPQVVKESNRIDKILFGHNIKGAPQEEVVLVKAAAVGEEYLVPILRGCKEPRRSLFFWEPFCIATS
ncbi:hypothetical protein RND81_05G255800 [Saponaria officinalis]|uniref:FAF domain-containing protein n=1 Tax=Saponaria officinalis TaxID=3572 RepID=A0AAW1L2H9_SAPOF